jgi:DNA-binding MarR family transcriptional regulator
VTTGPHATGGDAPVRGLHPAEQLAWRTFRDATRGLLDVLERQLQTDADLPMTYYEVLAVLSEAPDRSLRMGELARRLRSPSSRLSHAITRLESASLVRRDHLPSDRRGAVAVLTDSGADALAAATPGHLDAIRRHLLDPLTPEQLTHLTEISSAILAANPIAPAPGRRAEDRKALPRPRPSS